MAISNLQKELNIFLSNLGVLNIKLHNLHWYIKGQGFFELHKLFEKLYDEASEQLDEVAEELLIIEGTPFASLKEYLDNATIKERGMGSVSSKEAISIVEEDYKVLLDHAKKILEVAEEDKVQIIVDMMAGFIGAYEKFLWMVRAYKG
ncbi:Dps family protein [Clostridium hydrogeniformans]|uniref:Dps family protein n=1 Tax=Clostridium hydrogeniformans TaxID=349933 RepID=UPI000484A842|nr:DNA starvation/stationary phase protection protein [Clostridium hydrogeniformans]